MSPNSISRLVAIGALGWSVPEDPVRNPYTTHMPEIPPLLCENMTAYQQAFTCRSTRPSEIAEHDILQYRADEAAARLTWPFADRGLSKRLHRIRTPTLLVWGARDRIVSPRYAERFAGALRGPTHTEIIAGAGHLASIDAPEAVAQATIDFFAR